MSGWSMPVWPRNTKQPGSDTDIPPKRKKKKRPKARRDPEKFKAALVKAIGSEAADEYLRRK